MLKSPLFRAFCAVLMLFGASVACGNPVITEFMAANASTIQDNHGAYSDWIEHRPDVLPVDDLGIVNAVQRLYKLRKRPDAVKLYKLGDAWRPYRSVASWYLWQSLTLPE